ncbi:MAG: hypothetical protein H7A46_12760 [Verrucomicrobiales bacterium]|nr:hypothetical protein [Verrucomicrobiales bacterium]
MKALLSAAFLVGTLALPGLLAHAGSPTPDLWPLAREQSDIHRYATLFTAQDVRDRLANETGLAAAIDWCRHTGVTHAFIECFRDGYQAERTPLAAAMARFRQEGIEVSGCVTPTRVGKASTGWNLISCYTDPATQERVKAIFEFAASLSDEIMIDDFWFTDCQCDACDAARKAREVRVGERTFPVNGNTWEDYHCELMVQVSRAHVLGAAEQVNPNARLIIKYPQWYDRFHERGYEVVRETEDFDRIWVGTETRDYADPRWGGTVQYEAYFIMRWLGGIGGAKCGGGWFDPYGTTEATYVEQARQTILGGARESLLFCYGSLLNGTGPKNVAALRAEMPDLFAVAREVVRRNPAGLAAYKPANSHPEKEDRVFDFVGMLGLPLVPCHEFPGQASAGFFSVHALKDPNLVEKLGRFIADGKPVLVTDGLVAGLKARLNLAVPNVQVLKVGGNPKSLLQLPQPTLDNLREPLLKPFNATLRAPNKVGLYLFVDGSWVIENFNDEPAEVEFNGNKLSVDARAWVKRWK